MSFLFLLHAEFALNLGTCELEKQKFCLGVMGKYGQNALQTCLEENIEKIQSLRCKQVVLKNKEAKAKK